LLTHKIDLFYFDFLTKQRKWCFVLGTVSRPAIRFGLIVQ